MPALDFVTALSRLLHDGGLRDAFAANAPAVLRRLDVREADWPRLMQLAPADLEFQARVLLRKRFDMVRRSLPRTCAAMGEAAWPEFIQFARCRTSRGEPTAADATGFCDHLGRAQAGAVCQVERARMRFAHSGRRLGMHFARGPAARIFFRTRAAKWHEWVVTFRF